MPGIAGVMFIVALIVFVRYFRCYVHSVTDCVYVSGIAGVMFIVLLIVFVSGIAGVMFIVSLIVFMCQVLQVLCS